MKTKNTSTLPDVVVSIRRQKPGPKPGYKKSKRTNVTTPKPVLMEMLADAASIRGEAPTELATHLGIGYPYLMTLMRGARSTSELGRETLEKAAEYLDATVAQVYLWAGVLHPLDFFSKPRIRKELATVYRALQEHPDWGGYCPKKTEWTKLSETSQTLIALLFEQVVGRTYLSRTHIAAEAVQEKAEA